MARKAKAKASDEEILEDPPISIDPYEVLSLEKKATADQIKSAYRKAALRYHPDKAVESDKATAHQKFQEIALAYAILSDERRRKRYDTTGNTSESLDLEDDDFNWTDFFREQTAAMVDGVMIEKIKKEYQGSSEEQEDILQAYQDFEGDMDAIYEQVMCSNVLDDDERFRNIIDSAIKEKSVPSHKAYTKETKASRKQRIAKAKTEEGEAMELAEELGVKDKLFGGKGSKKNNDEDALKALIQQRGQSRSDNFLANLEAKYGGGKGGKASKRKEPDEPPEELFARNAKRTGGKR